MSLVYARVYNRRGKFAPSSNIYCTLGICNVQCMYTCNTHDKDVPYLIFPLSSLQSWEELAGCDAVMVMFLRDLYSQCYNGTADSLLTNCHILCMLTRYTTCTPHRAILDRLVYMYTCITHSILHVFICRVPGLEKKQKKERKELQVGFM